MALKPENVQGDILFDGLPKRNESFFFFQINDNSVTEFCQSLKAIAKEITSSQRTTDFRGVIQQQKDAGRRDLLPFAGANIAFSMNGLKKIQPVLNALDLNINDQAFIDGMKKGAVGTLEDPKQRDSDDPDWESVFLAPQKLHGVVLSAGSDEDTVSQKLKAIKDILKVGHKDAFAAELATISGKVRPEPFKGHEHFGYADGISQPGIDGVDTNLLPGQDRVHSGVFLCGRDAEPVPGRPGWMLDGSFMCFRKLSQKVPEWNKFLVDASNSLGTFADQTGARLVGRWKSGCPVVVQGDFDDTNIGRDPLRNNVFDFTVGDFKKCPVAAHVRKTHPRSEIGAKDAGGFRGFESFHILRRGIPYGEEVDKDPNGERGLLFVCYQSSTEKGFQFLQKTWANAPNFRVDKAGLDPIIGQSNKEAVVNVDGVRPQDADRTRPLPMKGINQFVVPKGGEYFFTPSLAALTNALADVKQPKRDL